MENISPLSLRSSDLGSVDVELKGSLGLHVPKGKAENLMKSMFDLASAHQIL